MLVVLFFICLFLEAQVASLLPFERLTQDSISISGTSWYGMARHSKETTSQIPHSTAPQAPQAPHRDLVSGTTGTSVLQLLRCPFVFLQTP